MQLIKLLLVYADELKSKPRMENVFLAKKQLNECISPSVAEL
jgi:hypothetical protein